LHILRGGGEGGAKNEEQKQDGADYGAHGAPHEMMPRNWKLEPDFSDVNMPASIGETGGVGIAGAIACHGVLT
jgi:hypothetical protein